MRSTVSAYRPSITTRTGSHLERAWAYLHVARTTEDRHDFLGALAGALDEVDLCDRTDAPLVYDRVLDLQRERGPRLVPEQLAGVYADLAETD